MGRQLKVVADFYDFMLWLIRHTEKFPRHHRYSLGRDGEPAAKAPRPNAPPDLSAPQLCNAAVPTSP